MKVLIIGSGGREHALCWKLSQSPLSPKLYCMPGNAGTATVAQNVPVNPENVEDAVCFAMKEKIDFTIVGPELPLCLGIVDKFREKGLKIFGPDKNAARLEGSKCFAKQFMKKYEIPTAGYGEFDNPEDALSYLDKVMPQNGKIVVKADGLAAGKGVIIAMNRNEAAEAVRSCFDGAFGNAGKKIVIEEFLEGEEASILAFTDGKTIIPLLPSQDHKRIGDHDTGPNTGGMGAYCPAPVANTQVMKEVSEKILAPFLKGIRNENFDYRGIIYAGIMITDKGVKVLEFNVRFGDPETQPVLFMLESDLLKIMSDVEMKNLTASEIRWKKGVSVCVVMSAGGYPGTYEKGCVITGIDDAEKVGTRVFHAGTALKSGQVVTSGGRVLGITASGENVKQAIDNAYRGVRLISWKDCYYRNDIGRKALTASE